MDEDPETHTGTISADCPAGAYTLRVSISSADNTELASASAGFFILGAPVAVAPPTLTALSISHGDPAVAVELSPAFDSATLEYRAAVRVAQVTVAPTASDADATVAYRDGNGDAIADADQVATGLQVHLEAGSNTMKVAVSKGGLTTTYTVSLFRLVTQQQNAVSALYGRLSGGNTVTVRWSDPGGCSTKYHVYYHTLVSNLWSVVGQDLASTTTTHSYTHTGLSWGSRGLTYGVWCDADSGGGTPSGRRVGSDVKFFGGATAGNAPVAPGNVMIEPSDGELAVSWDAPANPSATPIKNTIVQYQVQWKSDAEDWDATDRQAVTELPPSLSHTITGLMAGTEYTVRVRAVSSVDDGAWSSGTTATASLTSTDATDEPTISGTPLVGETLTANQGTIADADGVPAESTFTYQWIRVSGGSEADIPGAILKTYTPVAADAGKKLKVKVSFTDNVGNDESRTSSATQIIGATICTPAAPQDAIWSACLTVETTGYYFEGPGAANNRGALSNLDFTVGGDTYTLDNLNTLAGDLYLGFTSAPGNAASDWVLHIGSASASFALSAAATLPLGKRYRWGDTSLSWSDGDVISVWIAAAVASNDAALSDLSLSGVTLVPAFAPRTIKYTASVGNSVSSTTVSATTNHASASAMITPSDADANAAGHQVSLGVGDTEITVEVTAEDGETTRTYEVTVVRHYPDPFQRRYTDDFHTLDAAGNNNPRGIWSDGETMWVADLVDGKLYAYNMLTGTRDEARDFDTLDAAGNDHPTGIWSDGKTIWVADDEDDKIYAYDLFTKKRVSTEDFMVLDPFNTDPSGLWSDGETMWVADFYEAKIYGYNLSNQGRDRARSKDIDTAAAGGSNPAGIWSDGETMWMASSYPKIFAFNMSNTASQSAMEFTLSFGDYRSHQGVWSDGETMWVSQYNEDVPNFDDTAERIVAYTAAPASPNAYLRALEVVDALLTPSYNRAITSYAAEAPDDATTATVVARSRNNFAEVSFTPADADGADGHQVALTPGTTTHVTVTVTAADGAATKSYSLAITPCELWCAVLTPSFSGGTNPGWDDLGRRRADHLTDADFTVSGKDYEFASIIATESRPQPTLELRIKQGRKGDIDKQQTREQLVLLVGDLRLRLSEAEYQQTQYDDYLRWSNSDLLWQPGEPVVLRLIETTRNAVGKPTISGTVAPGETLTAVTTGITDPDGFQTPPGFRYQWVRDDADIEGGTGETYYVRFADAGSALRVVVGYTDLARNVERVVSDATVAVPTPACDVWCGVLTLGANASGDAWGWDGSGTEFNGDELSDGDFSYEGEGYEFASVRVDATNLRIDFVAGSHGSIQLPATRSKFTLYVNQEPFALSAATYEAPSGAVTTHGVSWSNPGISGSSGQRMWLRLDAPPPNNPPAFNEADAEANAHRSVAENTPAGRSIGPPVAATDVDATDTLSYSLEGLEAGSFDIDAATGQLRTKAALNYEAKSSYSVTVRVNDGTVDATKAVTINVTDVEEPPGAPAAPTVSPKPGSNTELNVSWSAPANTGPEIDDYNVRYRVQGETVFTTVTFDGTGTSTTIRGLIAYTAYDVQVQAHNDEGHGEWSASGTAHTNASSVATLSELTLSGITFTPAFATETTSYSAIVGNDVRSTTVTAVTTHDKATRKILIRGVRDADVELAVGYNLIAVVVTAEDQVTTKTYTVAVTVARAESADGPHIVVAASNRVFDRPGGYRERNLIIELYNLESDATWSGDNYSGDYSTLDYVHRTDILDAGGGTALTDLERRNECEGPALFERNHIQMSVDREIRKVNENPETRDGGVIDTGACASDFAVTVTVWEGAAYQSQGRGAAPYVQLTCRGDGSANDDFAELDWEEPGDPGWYYQGYVLCTDADGDLAPDSMPTIPALNWEPPE